ncbi:MAG: tRNA pseudouridine(38-40) synthase TruA [Ilumatobacteraceae bacterium]
MPDHGESNNLNEPVALRRVRFVVAYDGSGFRGFAQNVGVTTVMGVLTDAISVVARHPFESVGAGRTDAGVHGWGQVISGDLPATVVLSNVIHRVNLMCGPTVVIRSGEWTDDDFSARFSASWRHYRYTIVNGVMPSPFLTHVAWHMHRPLSLPAMQLACDPLIGEHDFRSFCRVPDRIETAPEPSMKRAVMLARWSDVSEEMQAFTDQRVLRFEIRANAFCHQMVRSIVGMMIDIGTGEIHAGDVRGIMLALDRRAAPRLAPPHGLCLWEVGYPRAG